MLLIISCAVPESDFSETHRVPFDPDIYSWKTASWTPFTVSDTISGFAYGTPGGMDRYVAVARSGVIGWSDDGDIWHRAVAEDDDPLVPNPFNAQFNAVAWGGDIFTAVADDGKVAWSADGISWTAVGHSGGIHGFGSENIMGIAWGNGVFVAVGSSANVSRSPDGVDWLGGTISAFGGSQLNDIAFDSSGGSPAGGRFYIVGYLGKRGWSDDPSSSNEANPSTYNWHYRGGEAPFHTNAIRKVTVGRYGSGIGIGIVFDEWSGKRIAIMNDSDFGATQDNIDDTLDAGNFGNNTINGIAWGGGNFVAAGTGAMIGWWSGAEPSNNSERFWRADSFIEFQWWSITALAAMNGRFYAGGIGGKIGYSK